jgi:hypothetical protein
LVAAAPILLTGAEALPSGRESSAGIIILFLIN